MTTKGFRDFKRPRGARKSACPICGEQSAGTVQVFLRENRSGQKPTQITSFSKTLCEPHSVELYERIERALDEMLREGGQS